MHVAIEIDIVARLDKDGNWFHNLDMETTSQRYGITFLAVWPGGLAALTKSYILIATQY